jgi:glycerophosphoryl diester phosphodiesterase
MVLPDWSPPGSSAVLAHRGGAALGVANSIEVLALAAEVGTDVVEIDVQELGDGTLVLFHDRRIATGGSDRVLLADIDLATFERLSGSPAALLVELPDRLLPLGLGLYLDVKVVSPDGLRATIDALVTSPLSDSTVIGSFNPDIVTAVVADGRLPASVLYHDRAADPLELAARLGCSIVHPCFDSDPWMVPRLAGAWMDRVHEAGLGVVGWNTNDPALLVEMAAAGFDVICTDDPRLAPLSN